jgi:hypothetical protein
MQRRFPPHQSVAVRDRSHDILGSAPRAQRWAGGDWTPGELVDAIHCIPADSAKRFRLCRPRMSSFVLHFAWAAWQRNPSKNLPSAAIGCHSRRPELSACMRASSTGTPQNKVLATGSIAPELPVPSPPHLRLCIVAPATSAVSRREHILDHAWKGGLVQSQVTRE